MLFAPRTCAAKVENRTTGKKIQRYQKILENAHVSSTSVSNTANATITLLKSEAASPDSNNMKNTSFFSKTIIGVGIACAVVAALLLLKNNN